MIISRRPGESGEPSQPPAMVVTEVTDPEELAASRRRSELADRNYDWLETHGEEIFAKYRGKCICVSEGDVFAGDTALEAIALATSAHPDDDGRITYQVPHERAI